MKFIKKFIKNNRGFSLIELLASLTILSVFLLLIGSTLNNNYRYSNSFDQKLSSTYIAEGVISYYQAKGYDNLIGKINTTEQALLTDVFPNVSVPSELNNFTAKVKFTQPIDTELRNRIILLEVTVEAKQSNIAKTTILKGSVKDEKID